MSNWKKISDFITFSTKGITPKYVENSSIVVLNQKCIRNGVIDYSFSQFTDDTKQISETKFVKKGDILINSTGVGTAGRCAFVEELPSKKRLITDSHILLLRCSNYFEARCLSYLLFSFEKTLMSFMTGSSGQGELDKVVVLNLLTKLPENFKTQQKIAKVLSDLDAKIELNNKINAELEAMARTLYDYWFVQFDFPDANGKPYKSSGGKMVWNKELKREIPDGWEVKILGDICEIINGYAFKSEWYTDSGIKIIRTKNFENGYVDLNDLVYLDNEFAKQFEKFLLKTYDFLMVMVGASTGKYCTVNSNILPALQNQNMWRFISKIENQQLFLNLKLQRIVLELENTTNGSARGFFQKDSFLSKLIEIPNQDLIEDFCIKINSVFKRIDNNLKENQELASLRDWLLPMLMNGQVTVGEVSKDYVLEDEVLGMVAEPELVYHKIQKKSKEDRFELWLSSQKLAARGDIDEVVLRDIFNAMDNEDQ